jgi:hypothetical protein
LGSSASLKRLKSLGSLNSLGSVLIWGVLVGLGRLKSLQNLGQLGNLWKPESLKTFAFGMFGELLEKCGVRNRGMFNLFCTFGQFKRLIKFCWFGKFGLFWKLVNLANFGAIDTFPN